MPSSGVYDRGTEEAQPDSEIQASSNTQINGLGLSPESTPPIAASEMAAANSATSSNQMESEINGNDGSTPDTGRRLRRRSEASSVFETDIVADAMEPLTDEERRNWSGWVELESDPVSPTLLSIAFYNRYICYMETNTNLAGVGSLQLHITRVRRQEREGSRSSRS